MDKENDSPFTQRVARVSDQAAQYGHSIETTPRNQGGKRKNHKLSKNSPVATLQVSADVWQKALELSEGDARRIQIISTTEVVVHNHPYAWL
ncbi:MAG: hypothetical protein ABIR91_05145 [Candidatus Saccharimonadales bacterium]